MKAESVSRGRHRYYPCPKCADHHPSVTTLLDTMRAHALEGWLAKNGTAKLNVLAQVIKESATDELHGSIRKLAEERWKLTEETAFWKSGKESGAEAADIGMMAHAWLESHLKGIQVDLAALPQAAQNAVNAYLAWEKDHHLETIKTEETFYNCQLNYAGTCDWIGKLDGILTLGDWKTSSGIFFNYVIQSWCYVLADETQNAERLYGQIFIGRFGKDGSTEAPIYKRNEFPSIETAREIIMACGAIFKATNEWNVRFPYQKKPKEK